MRMLRMLCLRLLYLHIVAGHLRDKIPLRIRFFIVLSLNHNLSPPLPRPRLSRRGPARNWFFERKPVSADAESRRALGLAAGFLISALSPRAWSGHHMHRMSYFIGELGCRDWR
jgi:hypothetical protein